MKYQLNRSLVATMFVASGAILIAGCRSSSPPSPPPNAGQRLTQKPARKPRRPSQSNNGANLAYNMNAPRLPNARLTPGDTLDVTSQDFCVSGYSKTVRDVPQEVKAQVYQEYGITHREKGEYEVDHLISLELGGSNSIKNLWPQSYKTQPLNAHIKDTLENKLHDLICSGQVDAKVAQQDIAQDWVAAYRKYVGPLPSDTGMGNSGMAAGESTPRSHRHGGFNRNVPSDTATIQEANTQDDGKVWVNTKSGKYFRPGSNYYGATKQGTYMSASDAVKAGYVAAKEN